MDDNKNDGEDLLRGLLGEDFETSARAILNDYETIQKYALTDLVTPETSLDEIDLMIESRIPEDSDFWVTQVNELGSARVDLVVNLGPRVGFRGQEATTSPTLREVDAAILACSYNYVHGDDDELHAHVNIPGWAFEAMPSSDLSFEEVTERIIALGRLALVEENLPN